jgi:hypothetical protein
MYVAAFIYAKGSRLISIVPRQAQNVDVIFSNEDGLAEQAAQEYYNCAPIPGRDLFDALSTLKREAKQSREANAAADNK